MIVVVCRFATHILESRLERRECDTPETIPILECIAFATHKFLELSPLVQMEDYQKWETTLTVTDVQSMTWYRLFRNLQILRWLADHGADGASVLLSRFQKERAILEGIARMIVRHASKAFENEILLLGTIVATNVDVVRHELLTVVKEIVAAQSCPLRYTLKKTGTTVTSNYDLEVFRDDELKALTLTLASL